MPYPVWLLHSNPFFKNYLVCPDMYMCNCLTLHLPGRCPNPRELPSPQNQRGGRAGLTQWPLWAFRLWKLIWHKWENFNFIYPKSLTSGHRCRNQDPQSLKVQIEGTAQKPVIKSTSLASIAWNPEAKLLWEWGNYPCHASLKLLAKERKRIQEGTRPTETLRDWRKDWETAQKPVINCLSQPIITGKNP